MNLHFWTFRLQPPHAPPSSGDARCSGRAWPPIRFASLSAVLRTSHIPSSLVQSHKAVSSLSRNPHSSRSSTDYPFTSSCSPPRVATTQLLSVTGGQLRQRGTPTLLCTLTLKRTRPAFQPRPICFAPICTLCQLTTSAQKEIPVVTQPPSRSLLSSKPDSFSNMVLDVLIGVKRRSGCMKPWI
jgi:hypothetical protein